MKQLKSKEGVAMVTADVLASWEKPMQQHLGLESYNAMPASRKNLLVAIAASKFEAIGGTEDMQYINSNIAGFAPNVVSPTAGPQNGLVSTKGNSGSGDRQYLIGLCIAIAAKTVGLEMVQTVPATSQNITIQYLAVKYNDGDLGNAANTVTNVLTLTFANPQTFATAQGYVIAGAVPASPTTTPQEFIQVKYVKPSRAAGNAYIFTLVSRFTAINTSGTLSAIAYVAKTSESVSTMVANGHLNAISADLSTLTAPLTVASVANTTAVEDYVPNQTTNGLRRTLTRSEADAGTDRTMQLELKNDNFVIGNRTLNGYVSRLEFKRLSDQGIDPLQYLTAAMKNEVSQEVNYQIISAIRAYGLTNALEFERNGSTFNTYIGPKTVATKAFDAMTYATELFDMNLAPVTGKFAAVNNLINTMQYETVESIGTYLAMLISQASYAIGTDSRYGEADGVVLSAFLAGYLAASKSYTKLEGKDVDMTKDTGAKLSGTVGGIKVYVDVQMPYNSPYITVFRSNQDIKVDMPGIEGDNILVPGLAYLVKDLISSTELVPEGNGGKKIIIDSETDLVAIGERPWAGYLTFAFDVALPGMTAIN